MSRPAGRARGEVGQRLGVLTGQVDPGRVERRERGHPVRDRGRERLAEERPERDVLPGLDVARRPVVEPDDAEDVVGEVAAATGCAERGAGADDEAELGLDVEPGARPERRGRGRPGPSAGRCGRTTGVPLGTTVPAAAVVADRQVPPVGQQRLRVGAEDPADVGGVVERGVEVDVVGDLERQVQLDLGQRHEVRLDQVALGLVGEQPGEPACGPTSQTGRPSASSALSVGSPKTRVHVEHLRGRDRRQVEHVGRRSGRRPAAPRRRARTRRTAGCRRRTSEPAAPSTQVVVMRGLLRARPRASRSSSGS